MKGPLICLFTFTSALLTAEKESSWPLYKDPLRERVTKSHSPLLNALPLEFFHESDPSWHCIFQVPNEEFLHKVTLSQSLSLALNASVLFLGECQTDHMPFMAIAFTPHSKMALTPQLREWPLLNLELPVAPKEYGKHGWHPQAEEIQVAFRSHLTLPHEAALSDARAILEPETLALHNLALAHPKHQFRSHDHSALISLEMTLLPKCDPQDHFIARPVSEPSPSTPSTLPRSSLSPISTSPQPLTLEEESLPLVSHSSHDAPPHLTSLLAHSVAGLKAFMLPPQMKGYFYVSAFSAKEPIKRSRYLEKTWQHLVAFRVEEEAQTPPSPQSTTYEDTEKPIHPLSQTAPLLLTSSNSSLNIEIEESVDLNRYGFTLPSKKQSLRTTFVEGAQKALKSISLAISTLKVAAQDPLIKEEKEALPCSGPLDSLDSPYDLLETEEALLSLLQPDEGHEGPEFNLQGESLSLAALPLSERDKYHVKMRAEPFAALVKDVNPLLPFVSESELTPQDSSQIHESLSKAIISSECSGVQQLLTQSLLERAPILTALQKRDLAFLNVPIRPRSSHERHYRINKVYRKLSYPFLAFPSLPSLNTESLAHPFDAPYIEYAPDPLGKGYYFSIELKMSRTAHLPSSPQHFIFLVDRSRAIEKDRFESFKNGVLKSLDYLKVGDTFNVILFDTKPKYFSLEPVENSEESRLALRKFFADEKHAPLHSTGDIYDLIFKLCHEYGGKESLTQTTLHSDISVRSEKKVLQPEIEKKQTIHTILLSDGAALADLRSKRREIKRVLEAAPETFSLSFATCCSKKNLTLIERLCTWMKGEALFSPTNAAFPRKLAGLVNRLSKPVAHQVHLTAVENAETGPIRLISGQTYDRSPLYLNNTLKVYGHIHELKDFPLMIQGVGVDSWINIKQNISFKRALGVTKSLQKEIAKKEALPYYLGFLDDGEGDYLDKAYRLTAQD